MTFDPQQVGFTWPHETTLTNPAGDEMIVRPYAANFAGLRDVSGQRIEECYRYYTSTNGILTELEVKKWLAGGDEVCSQLLSAFRALFNGEVGTRLPLENVIMSRVARPVRSGLAGLLQQRDDCAIRCRTWGMVKRQFRPHDDSACRCATRSVLHGRVRPPRGFFNQFSMHSRGNRSERLRPPRWGLVV